MNNDTATQPYHWVKQLPAAIKDLDAIPLLGNVKPFDFDSYAKEIAEAFSFQNVSLKAGIPEWVSKDQLYTSISGTPRSLCFGISPLEGNVYLLVSDEEFNFFLASILHTGDAILSPLERPYEQVIKEFAIQELILLLSKGGFDAKLTPLVKETTEAPAEEYLLSIQIDTVLNQREFRLRLLLSPTFLAAWRARYPLSKENSSSFIANKTGQLAHLEIGKIILTKKEWSKVNVGDLLLFDTCSIDPKDEDKFRLMILVNGRPCFRARLKDHQLKILEFPLHYEVVTPMAKQPSDEDEDFENQEFEDEELEDEDFEDEDFDFDEDDDDFEDEDEETEEEETEHEESESGKEHETNGDFEEDEDSLTSHESSSAMTAKEGTEPPTSKASQGAKESQKSEIPTKVAADTESEKPQSFDSLPLNISVEIGRLHLSTAQLSSLQPGNLLELDIHPDDGVSLVFNDQVLAKGELLRIGETLGVRILEIGKN